MEGTIYRGWETQGVTAPRGETLGRQPLVPWPPRQPLWVGPNIHVGGGPTIPMTNTITIL
jgi:hypothetical protein